MKCMRVAALAERWDCSPGKVRAMIRDGELPVLRLGSLLRIPLAAVIAIEAQCEQQQTETALASAASQDATPGTSITPAVVSLRAARIAQARKRSSPRT